MRHYRVARRIDPHLVSAGPHRAEDPARERAALRRHGALHGMGVGGVAPMRYERGLVGVVLPAAPVQNDRERRVTHMRIIGLDIHPAFAEAMAWKTTSSLDEIITHPVPDAFRAAQNFRRKIEIPGFHVTTWFDVFQTSVLAAFNDIQSRVGNQKLRIRPNDHYFVYLATSR
jgi:hypothetical protein